MNRKPSFFTWKGLIFGAIIYGCFVADPVVILFEHLFFDLDETIAGGLVTVSIGLQVLNLKK